MLILIFEPYLCLIAKKYAINIKISIDFGSKMKRIISFKKLYNIYFIAHPSPGLEAWVTQTNS
jgi:hypothetical protein